MPSPETRKGYLYGHSAEVKERRTYGDISHVGYCFAAWIAYADSRQKLVLHTMPVL